MTIRETITNTLRALAEIPAVVELVREGERMRRSHVETALRLQLAKKQAHIERLQSRARQNSETISRALRENSDLIARLAMANKRVGDAADRNNELQNELGPAKALIAVKNRMIGALSDRIRELEVETEKHRNELGAWHAVHGSLPTIADLWRPVGDKGWRAMHGNQIVLVRGGSDRGLGHLATRRNCAPESVFSHYIALEPPRGEIS